MSGASTPSLPEGAPRQQFALTGRSVTLDPTTHAVRPDLADVRLAEHVFAPHYAAPAPRQVTRPTPLRRDRATDSAVLTTLQAGTRFELLDQIGDDAWGIASAEQLVGYLDRGALGELEA